jgi:pyruvate dehydrogenase E1 component
MFGLQRIGDLVWAAADMGVRGFLLGGTSGRTTLAGEGLQHQDGNSHILALPVPNLRAYDPAFAYEISAILQDGIRRMYGEGERIFYYITVMNEPYVMPAMPDGSREGILRGMYRLRPAGNRKSKLRTQLLGSGAILLEALKAQEILEEKFHVAADVWSVTSYKELYRDAMDVDRENLLHPTAKPRMPYVASCLAGTPGPIIAASDYLKALPLMIAKWMPRHPACLGTDGFGRSDSRAALRRFFEVDAAAIALAALSELHREGQVDAATLQRAFKELGVDPTKPNPVTV